MMLDGDCLVASPTDLASFLACRHKTSLDLLVAEGRLARPADHDPFTRLLRERGDAFERSYVDRMRAEGLRVVAIDRDASDRLDRTIAAMREGADAIVQAALGDRTWIGYADVLRRVPVPSALGDWSYEVEDTKLSRETRGGTILQLCVYSDLVGAIQGRPPDVFRVVTPARTETYRVGEFAAFYRQTKARFAGFLGGARGRDEPATYPEPVEHCAVCRWSARCDARRRADDHLSFVAGMGRSQIAELTGQGVHTLAALARMPVPLAFTPARGARATLERLREQARVQVEQRESGRPVFECLPVERDHGLTRLPEPRPGDLFLDLEGDMFGRPGVAVEAGETAREYLFGLGRMGEGGRFSYTARWAFSDADERAAFEAVMDDITAVIDADPGVHIYHYAPYEPSAFRRLAGRYATRGEALDRLLRGGRFVDLYAIVRRAVRAGVESYSIKSLEPFYAFTRDVPLDEAGRERRAIELALETGDHSAVTPDARAAVEGYNRDDCRSTLALRSWLEDLRLQRVEAGEPIPRPPLEPQEARPEVLDRDRQAEALRTTLLADLPDPADRTPEDRARYLLAHFVDWHRREERVVWGEYHRIREMPADDLLDEPTALAGLEFLERVSTPTPGSRSRTVVDRYRYPVQENDVREDDELRLPSDEKIGTVDAIDRSGRTVDIRKPVAKTECHPSEVIGLHTFRTIELEKSIRRIAADVITGGFDDRDGHRVVHDLLLGRPPRVTPPFEQAADESPTDFAVRTVLALEDGLLAIQGPPGSGKTFTGARMIAALVAAGRKVGVVANSHKVIHKLVVDSARASTLPIPAARKTGKDAAVAASDVPVEELTENPDARAWLSQPGARLLGGTAWMWARSEFQDSVDVLFVDEAGQMSLANALSVAPAARSVVLLGDPQQLRQPRKGSHPDGIDVSALDHILAGHETMPEDRGMFLATTWRLAPKLCAFTSELFYEDKLRSRAGLEHQRVQGSGRFDGAGIFVVPVEHDGCRNASDEEAEVVCAIVSTLLSGDVTWTNARSESQPLTPADILIVAPYNAHVARIAGRLAGEGDRHAAVAVGTVDKFQGQEAAVVIYSMATSRPEDAPRGMEFLYSPNRLNVATSRARCASILVLSPRLFEPDCKTPRHMRLANVLARAHEVEAE